MKLFGKLLQPSPIEIVVSSIFTLAILFATNTSTIFLGLIGSSENQTAQSILKQYSQGFLSSGSQALLGRFTNLLVWGVIGAIIYILIWYAINGYIAVRNDVVIGTRFTRPTNTKAQYWIDKVGRFLLRLGAVIVLLFIVIWTVQVWLPTSIQLFHRWVVYHSILPYARSALFAILGWLILLHLMVILLRLAFLRVRLIGADEAK